MVLGPRQGDVEQPQLFFDFLVAARGHVGRDVAVGRVDHEHHVPFQPLGRMDRAEDQVVVVQQRRAGEILGAFRRVEGQFGQQRLPVGEPRRQSARTAPNRVAAARRCRTCPARSVRRSGGPARLATRGPQRGERSAAGARPAVGATSPQRLCPPRHRPKLASRRATKRSCSISCRARLGPMPGSSCSTRMPATRSRGFSASRSSDSRSLMWAASRNLSPPNLT